MRAAGAPEPGFSVPAGTVTFLLTDVEGWVGRREADPEATARDIRPVEDILTAAVGRHHGVRSVEARGGDTAGAAFAHPSDAVACSLDIQRRLSSEVPGVRLRIALHTGEARRRNGGPHFGRTLSRCARLRDIIHGGQVILSRATAELVGGRLPPGASLRDLGTVRLPDLAPPEQVFQLLHPELPAEFPALRSLDRISNNLPVQLTTFIGREAEIEDISRLLRGSRMVTLTGSGGAGKTRLALQAAARVADEYPDGVWWVDLAPVSSQHLVPSAMATALSIREMPMRPLMDTITEELRERRALIVLDNCEHLVEACTAAAATLLQACPQLTVLATSRHILDVEGETAFRVPSLRLPDVQEPTPVEALPQSEAVQLFIDRATRARPNFRVTNENAAAVAHICRRLDGIPLAIELAAARTRLLPVERIASELSDVFHVLTGGARTVVPRHQTLRASVEWSHDLLGEDERAVLRRLSVFAGGFTLDAAEAVGAGGGMEPTEILDLLGSLVDKSLVLVEESGPGDRYRLLETIRQFGAQKLAAAGEGEAVRARHLHFFTALAEAAEPELEGAGMLAAVRTLRTEHDNIRAALDWALSSGRSQEAMRLAAALRIFWFAAGHWREARARYEAILAEGVSDRQLLSRGFLGVANNCFQLFDWPAAYAFAEEALTTAVEVGDRKTAARARALMGTARVWMGDFENARPRLDEAVPVARELGDQYTLSQAYWALASGEWLDEGDLHRARTTFEEALAAARRSGNPLRIGFALTNLGNMTGWMDPEGAVPLLEEAIRWLEQLGEPGLRAIALGALSWARVLRGDLPRAREDARQAGLVAAEAGTPGVGGMARLATGALRRAEGDLEAATSELEASANLSRVIPGSAAFTLALLARLRLEQGDVPGADSALGEAAGILGEPRGIFRALLAEGEARVARERGDVERAEALAHEALPAFAEAGMTPWVVDLLEFLAWTAAAHESHREAARLFGAAGAAREALGYVHPPHLRERYEADVALARSGVSDEEFEKAWAEGAAMSMNDAVAYARRGRGERKRPSVGWASLTPTEVQVARLVSDRLTNPQIAQRLFMSRGTVKAHLSHIYAKLGISSRLELADEVRKHHP